VFELSAARVEREQPLLGLLQGRTLGLLRQGGGISQLQDRGRDPLSTAAAAGCGTVTSELSLLRRLWNDATARTPLELVSPLRREEVERRLKEAIDSDWIVFGGKPVVGRVDPQSFRLRCRIRYRNSFQTLLFGTLADEGRKTRLHCRTGMHPFVALFMAIWLGAVGMAAAVTMAVMLQPSNDAPGLEFAGAVPFVMLAFGVCLVGLGRRFAAGERERLIAFLAQTVDAREF
jgi:hypothetical protein